MSASTIKIGWIGAGRMGAQLVTRLLEAGYDVTVYNRTAAKAAALAPRVTRAWGSSPSILRSSSRIPRSSLKTVETLASEEMAGKGETVIVAVSARAVSVAARMVDAVEMARAVETVARAAMASLERAGRSGARHPRSCAKENRASLSVREESCVMAHALPPGRCSDVTEPP